MYRVPVSLVEAFSALPFAVLVFSHGADIAFANQAAWQLPPEVLIDPKNADHLLRARQTGQSSGTLGGQFVRFSMLSGGGVLAVFLPSLPVPIEHHTDEPTHEQQYDQQPLPVATNATGDQRQRLLEDIIHEMKTPIAAACALLQSSKKLPKRRILRRLMEASGNLDAFLAESRYHHQERNELPQRHGAKEMLAPALEIALPLAKNRGVQVRSQHLENIYIMCRAAPFARVAQALLENAVQHCPAGQTVDISASQEGTETTLRISNPGAPKDTATPAAERFVPGAVGSGLGMLLAQRNAREAGGSLQITATPEGNMVALLVMRSS